MSERAKGGLFTRAFEAMLGRYPKIAYIHVPKCAGVSVVNALHRAIYLDIFRLTRASRHIDLNASKRAKKALGLDTMRSREVMLVSCLSDPLARFVSGHVVANPNVVSQFTDWKFVTLLRNPTSRFVSQYVYDRFKESDWAKIRTDFHTYVDSDRARKSGLSMTRYFSGMTSEEIEADPDRAVDVSLQNLEKFFSVGFVEDLDAWVQDLSDRLGRRLKVPKLNKSPKPAMYKEIGESAELSSKLNSLCAVDTRIYRAARTRFAK
jgi:hypothetical protein